MTNEVPAKPKHKGGQPTKLTPERMQRIIELAGKGVSRRAMAEAVGIDPSSLYKYLADKDGRNAEFALAVKKAESELEERLVNAWMACIKPADPKSWVAIATFLSRWRPNEYAETKRVENTVQNVAEWPPKGQRKSKASSFNKTDDE